MLPHPIIAICPELNEFFENCIGEPTELNSDISAVSADRKVISNQTSAQQTSNVQISKARELRQAGVLVVENAIKKGKKHGESLGANANKLWCLE
jgi:hypothetical protein